MLDGFATPKRVGAKADAEAKRRTSIVAVTDFILVDVLKQR